MSDWREEIENLLMNPVAETPCPIAGDSKVLLFGAGQNGKIFREGLLKSGIDILGFIDESPEKQRDGHCGKPVWSPAQAFEKFGSNVQIIVSLYRNGHRFIDTRSKLKKFGFEHSHSLVHVVNWFPALAPFYCFSTAKNLTSHHQNILKLYDLLADDISKEGLLRVLQFRLFGDNQALDQAGNFKDKEFIFEFLKKDGTQAFVDGGCFDGDTIDQFLSHVPAFKKILGFEPDPHNFVKLKNYVSGLPSRIRDKIEIREVALADQKGLLKFSNDLGASSRIADAGTIEVQAQSLDDVIAGADFENLYIKFDLEGGELLALKGCQKTITKGLPLLGISLYHRPNDLWELPFEVLNYNSNYRFFLRMLDEELIDLMVYARPQK